MTTTGATESGAELSWPWMGARIFVMACVGAVLLSSAALMVFAVPALDDFCKASLSYMGVKQPDTLTVTWLYYWGWSPRWVTTAIQSAVMSHVDLVTAYAALLLLVMVSTIAALTMLFGTVLSLPWKKALLASSAFYAAWVSCTPAARESLYWLTGAFEYQLPMCVLLVLLSILLRSVSRPLTSAMTLTAAALSFVLPAQHELAGLFLCGVLTIAILWSLWDGRSPKLFVYSAVAAAASMVIVVVSPGSAARAVEEQRTLWDFGQSATYIKHVGHLGLDWAATPIMFLLALWLLPQVRLGSDYREKRPAHLAFVCVVVIAVVMGELLFVEVASGGQLPERALGFFHLLFCLSVLFLAVFYGSGRGSNALLVGVGTVASVILGLNMLFSPNVLAAGADLMGPAPRWHASVTAMLRAHSDMPGEPPERPGMYLKGLSNDPNAWPNRCAANYMGIESVRVGSPQLTRRVP